MFESRPRTSECPPPLDSSRDSNGTLIQVPEPRAKAAYHDSLSACTPQPLVCQFSASERPNMLSTCQSHTSFTSNRQLPHCGLTGSAAPSTVLASAAGRPRGVLPFIACFRADQRVPLQAGYTAAGCQIGVLHPCLRKEAVCMELLCQGKRAAQREAKGVHRYVRVALNSTYTRTLLEQTGHDFCNGFLGCLHVPRTCYCRSDSSSQYGHSLYLMFVLQKNTEFGYSRKDVLLIGGGIFGGGFAMYYGLQAGGVSAGMAGNFVQLFVVLGLCVGWIGSYIFRVANKVSFMCCPVHFTLSASTVCDG